MNETLQRLCSAAGFSDEETTGLMEYDTDAVKYLVLAGHSASDIAEIVDTCVRCFGVETLHRLGVFKVPSREPVRLPVSVSEYELRPVHPPLMYDSPVTRPRPGFRARKGTTHPDDKWKRKDKYDRNY